MSCPLYVFIESSGFQWLARDFWTFKFKFSENPGTGRRAYEGGEERLAIDALPFDKAIDLCRHLAKLLGYPTWADYITEVMTKTDANDRAVRAFLETAHAPTEMRSPAQFLDD